jgi:hypothetical protein
MLFTAKCFWPAVTLAEVERAGDRARDAARLLTRTGRTVAYLGAFVVKEDELVLCLFEASSRTAVTDVTQRARIPCERLMETAWLSGRASQGRAACITTPHD